MERKTQQRNRRPIDYLKESIGKVILIKAKRNRLFRATLLAFDEYLNVWVDNASQIFEYQDEEGNIHEEHENLGEIVIRGDNIIFINMASSE